MAVTNLNDAAFAPSFNSIPTRSYRCTAAADVTPPFLFKSQLAVAVTGTATAVEIVVERCVNDPAGTPRWAKVGDSIIGNPSTGIAVQGFLEPGVANWRGRVASIAGGYVDLDFSGTGAR